MSDRILIGTRKGLFSLKRAAANSWSIDTTDFLGDPVTISTYDSRSGYYYASLKHGHFGVKLHRSKTLGGEWEEIACPTYPPFPDGREPDRCPMRDIEIPWTLEQIWALVPGGSDQPGRLWCGTIPGGLFKSDNNGDSWTIVDSVWNRPERLKWFGGGYDFPGIHSICVSSQDSKQVTFGVSCGGVWRTEDDGESWSLEGKGLRADFLPPEQAYDPIPQDVHFMAQCAEQPDSLWIQHHNGIFRSTDGGRNFSEIKEAGPSVFGFAVAVHPKNPDTAWFAPAIKDELRIPKDGQLVITRTRDGGESFDILRSGLPQEHAYDLIYRHGLAVDHTGSRLALGSTTGSIWVTENQGDDWTLISNNLPPVYSIGFQAPR